MVGEVLSVLENQGERLEEAVKNVKVFGQDLTGQYVEGLNAVSAQQVQQFVADLIKGAPTFVLQGGMVNQMHSLDKITNALKL